MTRRIRKLRDQRNYMINSFPRLLTRDIDPDIIAPRSYIIEGDRVYLVCEEGDADD